MSQTNVAWRRRQPRVLAWITLAGMLLGALAACGGTESTAPAAMPQVSITATEYTFGMPESLPGGLVAITLSDQGKEPHQANLARLNSGVTPGQFLAALTHGPAAALPLVDFVGGPNTIDPGMSQTVVVNLPAGQYVALCFVSSPDGHTHVEKGMITFFKVNAPSAAQPAVPRATNQVTLEDFTIGLPSSIKAGTVTWKVTNTGRQPHEMAVIKLAPGKSLQDATEYLRRPAGLPPFSDAGGMAALAPQTSAWVRMQLETGNYVAVCFVPDTRTGKPHFELGMITPFSVR